MDRLLTTRDIADLYGVNIKTAAYWCRKGLFPHAQQLNVTTGRGQVWVVPESDLERFIKPGAPGVGRPAAEAEVA